jgi:hypothetical protein
MATHVFGSRLLANTPAAQEMPVAIWTRLSLDVVKQELIKERLPLSRFKFLSRPQDISRAQIILGQIPPRSETIAACLRWVQLDSVDAFRRCHCNEHQRRFGAPGG